MGHCSVLSHTNWSTSGHESTLCPGCCPPRPRKQLQGPTSAEYSQYANVFLWLEAVTDLGHQATVTINVYPDGDYGMVEGQLYQDAF